MRRILAISLLLLLGLPLVAPLFADGAAEASVPACCRRDGKHHCMMMQMESQSGDGVRLAAVRERCPYCPTVPVTPHLDFAMDAGETTICSAVVSHPCGVAQTEARLRISFDRSRQKRGPPLFQS